MILGIRSIPRCAMHNSAFSIISLSHMLKPCASCKQSGDICRGPQGKACISCSEKDGSCSLISANAWAAIVYLNLTFLEQLAVSVLAKHLQNSHLHYVISMILLLTSTTPQGSLSSRSRPHPPRNRPSATLNPFLNYPALSTPTPMWSSTFRLPPDPISGWSPS